MNDGACYYDSRIGLLSPNFASYIANYNYDPVILLSGILESTAKTQLTLSDYEYLKKKLNLLLLYLKKAYTSKRKGVNILFYGLPGTGKTQLAKVLADHLSVELYNVSSENCDGVPITGIKRLRACCSGQHLLTTCSSSMLLFDEIEDVFADGEGFFSRSTAQKQKAWVRTPVQ